MKIYEALIVFKPILDVENVDAILTHFQKNLVEGNQGKVLEADRIGRKRLAYEIKKFKDGFLTLYRLQFPPDKIADFRRACQLNEDVLRITLVHLDDVAIKSKEARKEMRDEGSSMRHPNRRGDFRPGGNDFRGGGDRGERFAPAGGPPNRPPRPQQEAVE